MLRLEIKKYNSFYLVNFYAEDSDDFNENEISKILNGLKGRVNLRIEIPTDFKFLFALQAQKSGYFFSDRTLGVSINLKKNNLDFSRLIRFEIKEIKEFNNFNNFKFESIFNVAKNSFPYDSRFNVRPENDLITSQEIIKSWCEKFNNLFVALHKEKTAGFLDLEEIDDEKIFIRLAAVDERYRAAGAAMSLYSNAVKISKERNFKKLEGRISSFNMPVMNLYSFLGANFYEPHDIFLKEIIL